MRRLLALALVLGVLGPPARSQSQSQSQAQQEICFADCDGGLAGLEDLGPGVGESAPDFEGVFVDAVLRAATPSTLERQFQGRPVLLVFGSYT